MVGLEDRGLVWQSSLRPLDPGVQDGVRKKKPSWHVSWRQQQHVYHYHIIRNMSSKKNSPSDITNREGGSLWTARKMWVIKTQRSLHCDLVIHPVITGLRGCKLSYIFLFCKLLKLLDMAMSEWDFPASYYVKVKPNLAKIGICRLGLWDLISDVSLSM